MFVEETAGLVLVIAGGAALALVSYTPREIAAALAHAAGRPGSPETLRRSVRFWESCARNAWTLAALAALLGLVTLVSSARGGEGLMAAAGRRVVPIAVALILSAALAVVALRVARRAGEAAAAPADAVRGPRGLSRAGGLALFAAAVLAPLLARGDTQALGMVFHWPAWLVVAGVALAVALYLGEPGDGTVPAALAVAGVTASLFGLAQAFRAFATNDGPGLFGGFTFLVSSCFAALVAMATAATPLDDPALSHGVPGLRAARLAAYGLPAFTFVVVALAIVLALIPLRMG